MKSPAIRADVLVIKGSGTQETQKLVEGATGSPRRRGALETPHGSRQPARPSGPETRPQHTSTRPNQPVIRGVQMASGLAAALAQDAAMRGSRAQNRARQRSHRRAGAGTGQSRARRRPDPPSSTRLAAPASWPQRPSCGGRRRTPRCRPPAVAPTTQAPERRGRRVGERHRHGAVQHRISFVI